MSVAPSFQDLLAVGQAEAQTRRPDLTYYDGDITVAQNHAAAAMADAVIRLAVQLFKATFIDGAKGDELTALVDDHYNIQRQAATPGQGTVTFARTSGGGAGSIPAGTKIATAFDADGKTVEFTTDGAISVGAGSNGPWDIGVTAVIDGLDGNVEAGTIERVIDSLFDTFSVTNAAVTAGGNNEESDPDLRERVRSYFTTLRRGTLAALAYGAKEIDAVKTSVATDDTDTGLVTVQVGDSDGNSSAQMVADVEAEEENWRAAGTPVLVVGGTSVLVSIDITLDDVSDGFDADAAGPDIIAAVEARINKLKPTQTMRLDSIIAQVIAVYPDDIFDVGFSAISLNPGGAQSIDDVVPTAGQVLRPGTITVALG